MVNFQSKLKIVQLFAGTCFTLLAIFFGAISFAQQVPSNIKVIIPFAPGGPTDVLGRIIAESLQKNLKSTVITENRPGANGVVAVNTLKQGPVDGSNLLFVSSGMITFNPLIDPTLSYDPQKDLVPIICVAQTEIGLIIANNVSATQLTEFVQLSKAANPPLSLGSAGVGNILHAYIELFKNSANVDFIHVPYKGASPSFADVLGGQISGMFIAVSIAQQSIQAGKVKLIATVGKRSSNFPEVKTITEQGYPGVEMIPWFGIMGPRGMSQEAINMIANGIVQSTQSDDEFRKKLIAAGFSPYILTGAKFTQLIKDESNTWSTLIASKKINLNK
jgi:tripartite-type tricarboxylate transporter receptor subunit TctC